MTDMHDPGPAALAPGKGDTWLSCWWARWKLWHKPTMAERYFFNVRNELKGIPPLSDGNGGAAAMPTTPPAGSSPEEVSRIEYLAEARSLERVLSGRLARRLCIPMCDVYALELLVLRAMPDDRLVAKAWSIRTTYRQIVSKETYEDYQASTPPALDRGSTPTPRHLKAIREDAVDLLTGKHWWYSNSDHKERRIEHVKMRLVFALLLGLAVLAAMAGWSYPASLWPMLMLVLVAVMGMLGATLSMGRRILPVSLADIAQSDPVIRASQFDHGGWGLGLSVGVGGVSAVLLYLLMGAGLAGLAGKLMPELVSCCAAVDCKNPLSPQYFLGLMPENAVSFAKVMAWSFVAGFAEKLVPDILDRVANTEKEKDKGKAK